MSAATDATKPAGPARVWGVMGEFAGPTELLHGCLAVREAGWRKWDAYSPFPVHGLELAMGLKPSRVSMIVLLGAMCGAGGGFALQYWTSAVAYPMVVQGKPFGAWEPFTPVTFELGVLLASFGAILGMLTLNVLPRWHHPLFKKERFLKVSDDRFMVALEARDRNWSLEGATRLLKQAGATNIDVVEE